MGDASHCLGKKKPENKSNVTSAKKNKCTDFVCFIMDLTDIASLMPKGNKKTAKLSFYLGYCSIRLAISCKKGLDERTFLLGLSDKIAKSLVMKPSLMV